MGCILKGGGGLYSRLAVGGILLAAGAGERMGHRPKCLLELGGVALIRRQIIALSGAGVDELVVVLGHHGERIAQAIQEFPVTVVHNPDPDAGQVSSLRVGLRALSARTDAVLVALADQPLINAQDINELIGAYKKRPTGAQVVQPEVDGQPANPVLFSAEVREQILAGEARLGCKQWQAAHPEQVHRWVSTNQRYRTDVDTLQDIEALAERTGHRLRWPADLAPAPST
jgi:molybdenum cofactor cytidylyltransferase